jgi:predicted PilT family ATPase
MTAPKPVMISGAVEGLVDEVVLRRLVERAGGVLNPVHGGNGKSHLRQRIAGYNQAARLMP